MIDDVIKRNFPPCGDDKGNVEIFMFYNNPTVFCNYDPAIEKEVKCPYLEEGKKFYKCTFYQSMSMFEELLE